jgi:transposase-like protein
VAQQSQHNSIDQVLELLTEQGTDALAEALRLLLNAAMLFEREHFLQAAPYERITERRDYANGFKSKQLRTRVGEIDLRIPQVRGGDFYPQALERGSRSERALKLSLAEMYVQGVSTRKVKAITESSVDLKSQAPRFHEPRQGWMNTSSNGESGPCVRCLICKWMLVMRKFERAGWL